MEQYTSQSEEETMDIAQEFAKKVKEGDVICLYGNLGAGKTRFVRGFVRHFGLSGDEVSSPTFTIINEYEGVIPVYHFDCYRLKHVQEALEFGTEEYFFGDGVCIVEWPEKISEILPPDIKKITIETTNKNERKITIHQAV
jgi:tRNA threonylcarbamoyladenosine biosynthesis protein TsaE